MRKLFKFQRNILVSQRNTRNLQLTGDNSEILAYFALLIGVFYLVSFIHIIDYLGYDWYYVVASEFVAAFMILWGYIEIRSKNTKKEKTAGGKTCLVIERDKSSGRWEFQPEQIPATITWDREKGMVFSDQKAYRPYQGSYNVVLLKDNDGWVRIYGSVDAIILEIGFRKGKDFQTFHMTDPDVKDTVIPLTDENEEKALILRNPYSERFAVKK